MMYDEDEVACLIANFAIISKYEHVIRDFLESSSGKSTYDERTHVRIMAEDVLRAEKNFREFSSGSLYDNLKTSEYRAQAERALEKIAKEE